MAHGPRALKPGTHMRACEQSEALTCTLTSGECLHMKMLLGNSTLQWHRAKVGPKRDSWVEFTSTGCFLEKICNVFRCSNYCYVTRVVDYSFTSQRDVIQMYTLNFFRGATIAIHLVPRPF